MTEALELRKKKLAQADESESSSSSEDEPPRAGPSKARRQSEVERASDAGSSSERNGVTVAGHGDLPPLALSTNPLFPNAIVKRPSNTHARAAVPQPPKAAAAPPPPPTPRVHTGKNAPVSFVQRSSGKDVIHVSESLCSRRGHASTRRTNLLTEPLLCLLWRPS